MREKDYFRSTYATRKRSPVLPTLLEQPGDRWPPGESGLGGSRALPRSRAPRRAAAQVPHHWQTLPRRSTIALMLTKLGQQLTKLLSQTTEPALYKSFNGFEEDASKEHAAGGGRERSFSRPQQHQWEALESDPGDHEPFQWGFTVKISGRIQRGTRAA